MIFNVPLELLASAAFIFSRRQARQRQPLASASEGMGTRGSSKHQQLPSGVQDISEPHFAQRVCIMEVWGEEKRGKRGKKQKVEEEEVKSRRVKERGRRRVTSAMGILVLEGGFG